MCTSDKVTITSSSSTGTTFPPPLPSLCGTLTGSHSKFLTSEGDTRNSQIAIQQPHSGGPTVDYLEQFCAISKVPMVLIKESTN